MDGEGDKISDGTGFQPSQPKLCANGCGFFGTAATMNLCSKCYRDLRIKEEQAPAAKAAMDKLVSHNQTAVDGLSAESGVGSSSSLPEDESSALVLPSAGVGSVDRPVVNRCSSCKKKVGVMGFQCRCGATLCGAHRYPEKHDCSFDFKAAGRDAIAKGNPVVKSNKVERL